MTFKKKVAKFHLESESKIGISLKNIIIRTAYQLLKRKEQNGVSVWKQSRNVTGTFCNTRTVEQIH